jgi:hypothetical protein
MACQVAQVAEGVCEVHTTPLCSNEHAAWLAIGLFYKPLDNQRAALDHVENTERMSLLHVSYLQEQMKRNYTDRTYSFSSG